MNTASGGHAAQVRSDKATARMTPDEREQLEAAAARAGLGLGGYSIEAVLRLADQTDRPRRRRRRSPWTRTRRCSAPGGEPTCHRAGTATTSTRRSRGGTAPGAGLVPMGLAEAVQLTNGVARRVGALAYEHCQRRNLERRRPRRRSPGCVRLARPLQDPRVGAEVGWHHGGHPLSSEPARRDRERFQQPSG